MEVIGTIVYWVGIGLTFYIATDLFAHGIQNIFIKERV